jgi:hypothetical protein
MHLDREGTAGPVLVRVERPPVAEGTPVRFAMPPAEVHVFDTHGVALPRL